MRTITCEFYIHTTLNERIIERSPIKNVFLKKYFYRFRISVGNLYLAGMKSRRDFLKRGGLIGMGLITSPVIPGFTGSSLSFADTLKITEIEVIQFDKGHWTWIKVHTDQGIYGLGETYPFTHAELGAMKDLAHVVLGRDPRDIAGIWKQLYTRAAFNVTGGAEMRMISAIDIALWDLAGKYYNLPVYQLLGGKAMDSIRVYNTTNGLGEWNNEEHIEQIAKYLLDRGIKAMKIWPLDPTARKNHGSYISPAELEVNLDWVKRIRDAVGDEMEIAMEFHAYWNLPCSQRIAEALEPYNIMWIEDIMFPENTEAYSKLAAETSIPICISERLATRFPYLKFLEAKACDIAMYDVTWCGGLTSARKIADLADTFMVPSAPHTFGGPVLWYASMHLAITLTNLWIMESGYYFYNDVYPDYLDDIVVPDQGFVSPPDTPGLGIVINEEKYSKDVMNVERIG